MINNDTFYGLVFERDRVQTLLNNCSSFELSGMLEYIVDRRFAGWNKIDDCFRVIGWDVSAYDTLFAFFQKGRVTFDDLLAAYNRVTYSSINPKFQSYYIPGGTVIEDDTPAITDDFEEAPKSKKPVKITNPRWEHKDGKKKTDTPDTAAFGDTLILKADLENHIENGTVMFDIYDKSNQPEEKIATINGIHSRNVGVCEWKLECKNSEPKLEFIASVSIKKTVRCLIKVKQESLFFFSS